jgi:hypothetical protein
MIIVTLLLTALAGVRGNLEITEEAVYQAVYTVADSIAGYEIESLFISVEGGHDGAWLVSQSVTDLLSSRGVNVVSERSEREGNRLIIRPMQLGVVYGGFERSWFLGSRRLRRSAICSLSFTLADGSGTVLNTWRSEGLVEDTVSPDQSSVYEHRTEKWVNDTLPGNTGNKVLEPIVVTGVVAALIYLFYSSRAD